MAITENSFTAEEFSAALTANPDLVTLVGGFVVNDANKEHPLRKAIEPAIISPVTSRHAKEIEEQVEKITGVKKKEPNQKYYEYLDYAVTTKINELSTAQQNLTTELEELRKSKNPSEQDKARIQQLEKALADNKTEWENKLSEKEKHIFELKAGGQIQAGVAELRAKYKKDMPAKLVELAEKNAVNNLLQKASIAEDGTVVYLDGAKAPIVNPSTMKPLTTLDLLALELADLIDTGKQQEGAGSGAGGTPTPGKGGEKGKFTTVPATVKSKSQFYDYLLELGYTDYDEMDKLVEEHGKGMPMS